MAHLLALPGLGARAGAEVVAGLEGLEHVDERAPAAPLDRGAAEGIVGPVHREDAAHSEPASVANAAVDVLLGALGLAQLLAAAKEVRGFDPNQHREPAPLDRLPRLPRVVDQAEPALALAAGLRVDVALQATERLDLLPHRLGLVTRMDLAGLDLADRLVLDRLGDDEALAGHPGTLQPDVIGLLVGDRVVDRPARKGGPAVGVVRAEGKARAEQVAGDVVTPVRSVDASVVTERLADAVRIERLAVDHRSPGALIGGDVQMHVGEADDVAVAVGPAEGRTARAHVGLGERSTALLRNQGETGSQPGRALAEQGEPSGWGDGELPPVPEEEPCSPAETPHGPFGCRPWTLGASDLASGTHPQEPPHLVLGQIGLQGRGLPEKRGGRCLIRLVRPIDVAADADEPPGQVGAQRKTGIGQLSWPDLLFHGRRGRARSKRRNRRADGQTSGHAPANQDRNLITLRPLPSGLWPRSGVELGQLLGLVPELALRRRIELAEGLRLHLALLVAPGARHPAVNQEGRNRLRGLGVEDLRPVLLG